MLRPSGGEKCRLTVLGLAAALLVENVTFPLGMVIRCKDNRFLNPAPKKIGGDNLRLSHGGMPFHMEGIEDCRMRSVLRRKSDCELRLVVSELTTCYTHLTYLMSFASQDVVPGLISGAVATAPELFYGAFDR